MTQPLPTQTEGVLAGQHVLLVEDHADTRELLHAALEHEGAIVTSADDAEDALGMIRAGRCDLIVTDFNLRNAGRNGAWLLERARATSQLNAVPAVAVTGRKDLEADLQRAGFAQVFVKPINFAELPKRLARLLKGR